ncbi:MAG: DUF2461 domain-containing protein [Bacteroidota bacterium]
MTKKEILHFLQDLSDNNSKEWMDAHRSRYQAARDSWLALVQEVLDRLKAHNPDFGLVRPKDTVSRINNNRRFHKDKPLYKDFFSCEPSGKGTANSLFYFAMGLSWSFVGGGMYHPPKEKLSAFRSAIDYNGEEFRELVQAERAQAFYGGLSQYADTLKTAPAGYPKDHPHVEFLRLKSITLTRDLTTEDFIGDGFLDLIEEAYLAFRPVEEYILEALEFAPAEV